MPFAAAIGTWLGASSATAASTGVAAYAIGTTAVGMGMQASAQHQAGKAKGKWQEYNAAISEREAEATKEAAIHEEKAHRKAGARHKARMRALYGKANLSIEPGTTPYLTLEETAGEIEKDAFMIRRGGILGEKRFRSQAGIERSKGKFARRAGRWRSGATLLSGSSRMADIYGRGKGYW